jgi:hypothetical protein
MLVTADSGFYSWQLWDLFASTGAALCWRVGAAVTLPLVRRLSDGSYLALIFAPNTTARRKAALLAAARAGEDIDAGRARLVRAVEYTVPDRGGSDGELICVITTILEVAGLTAAEVTFAYHQRWEHESGLDEIKTHLRSAGGILRSQSLDLVEQDMWGILLAHYAIRELMCRAADEAERDPDRISFIRTVRLVRRQIDDPAAFSPDHLTTITAGVFAEILQRLNPLRRDRTCPRAVKRARHNSYRVKRPGDVSTTHASPPTIKLEGLPTAA